MQYNCGWFSLHIFTSLWYFLPFFLVVHNIILVSPLGNSAVCTKLWVVVVHEVRRGLYLNKTYI